MNRNRVFPGSTAKAGLPVPFASETYLTPPSNPSQRFSKPLPKKADGEPPGRNAGPPPEATSINPLRREPLGDRVEVRRMDMGRVFC